MERVGVDQQDGVAQHDHVMNDTGSMPVFPPGPPQWRLFAPADMPFLYELVTKVDPRWWRFSRHGLEPSRVIETTRAAAAAALVSDGYGKPVACALLADAGVSGTGVFEFFARPDPDSQQLAREFAPQLLEAAFAGTPIRRLYHDRFDNDTDVLGEVGRLFEVEVVYPNFALIDGKYEARTTSVLTAESFKTWRMAAQ